MKKFILILTILMGFLSDAMAIRVVTVEYSNSCFIGCGTIKDSKDLVRIDHPDGTWEIIWERKIACSGFGFHGCPTPSVTNGEPNNWLESISAQMFDHAATQIQNAVLSGEYNQTFVNSTTGEIAYMHVEWTRVLDGNGNPVSDSIVVSRDV